MLLVKWIPLATWLDQFDWKNDPRQSFYHTKAVLKWGCTKSRFLTWQVSGTFRVKQIKKYFKVGWLINSLKRRLQSVYWCILIFFTAEELKEAKSNNTEEEDEEESDEDAIREAVKAQKNSKNSEEEDEDEDEDEDEEDSGSGSGRSASVIPDKPSKRSPHKVWEF